ncbi:MAG: hypothetical protein KC729_20420, partial [Candidatus Eisenbacteria bacterium]|nr:hypothetical protein [Candidatus Eisenbacteria bacterium]
WARSHADAARFDTRALQRRIEEEIQANIAANRWNDDRWSQEWIREQIENGLDAEREALEAELDALREELSSEDRESRREALRDAQSETREILRELRQSREEVLRKLEREVERQTRRSRRETRHSSDVAPHSGSRSTDAGVSGTAVGSAWATAEVATAAESSEAWVSEPAEAGWAAPDPEELESPASPTATPDPTLFAAVVQDAMSALPSTPYSPSPDIRDEDDLGSYPTDLWTAWESDVLRAGGSDHDVLLLSDHDVQTLDLDPGIYVITEDGPTKLVESSSTVVLATPSWRTGGSAGDDGAFALLEDGDVFRLAPLTRRQLKNRLRPSAPLAPAAPSAPSAQVAPLAPLAPRAPFMVTPKTPLAPSAPFMLAPKAPRAPLAELPDVPWVIDGRTIVRQPAGDGIDRETRRSQW